MRKLLFRVPGVAEPISVEIQRSDAGGAYTCQCGATQAEVEYDRFATGGGRLRIHGRVIPFYAVQNKGSVGVWIGGRTYTLELVDMTRRRAVAGRGPVSVEIVAPMPGTILTIHVKAGDRFEAHQPLIIMESMKMEMTLSAPHAGRIKEITCKVGELTTMGMVLARLEAVEGDDAAE